MNAPRRPASDLQARNYSSFVDCVPKRDVCLADANGEIAGYLRCWPFVQADGLHLYAQFGVMAPNGRRRGIGRALQVADQVRTYVDATWNRANGVQRGWTEFISVGESWRRRGLAGP